MLETLTLENFQTHKRLVVKFDKYVTVIVGDSDTGKSSIIRALGWVAFNRPTGIEFIRWGADAAVVTLEADGQIIVRSRSKKENVYLVNGDEFTAFGNDVPPRVVELLRMNGLNFQTQMASPFWFDESGGEVSKRLNHVVNLGVIDEALTDISSKLRKAKSNLELIEDRLKKASQTKKDLVYVVRMNAELVEVETAEKQHIVLRTRVTRLRELLSRAQELKKKATQKLPDLSPLEASRNHYERIVEKREELQSRIATLRTLWKTRKVTAEEYERAHAALHEKMDGQCPLCGHPTK